MRADGGRASARARCTRRDHGPVFTSLARAAAVPVDAGDRVRDGRRQRGQLPLPQPLLRGRTRRRARASSTPIERRYQGIPWVNTIAADSRGQGLLRRHRRDPATCPTSKAPGVQHGALGIATFRCWGCRCSTARARDCDVGHRPRRRRAGHLRPVAPADAVPRRLRHELQRLLLARQTPKQPLEGFARIIGDERTTRSLRTRIGLQMVDRPAGRGGQFTLADAAGHGLQQPPVRAASCGATSWSRCAAPTRRSLGTRPGRRQRACPVLEKWDLHDEPRLARRDPVPPLRVARAGRGRGAGHRGQRRRSTQPTRSTRRAASTPTNPRWRRRSPTPSPSCAAPASRSTPRCASYQSETRGDEKIPIHGGPGDPAACSTRSTSPG